MAKVDLARFVIAGGHGMIGSAIPWGRKLSRAELNVAAAIDVAALDRLRPSGIMDLAALDIRQSEKDPELAMRVNAVGARSLAEYASSRGIPFAFLSSATVFRGPRGSVFFEDSATDPAPLNVYGRTKREAENLIFGANPDALIIRTGWVFGGHGAHHRKFVDVAIGKARAGEVIQASNDQDGSPVFVKDLVDSIESLLRNGHTGLVHVVNDGAATAALLAERIVRSLGSSSRIEVLPNQNFQASFSGPAPARSASEVLGSRNLQLRKWQAALEDYLQSRDS